jgi:hypothetical protein
LVKSSTNLLHPRIGSPLREPCGKPGNGGCQRIHNAWYRRYRERLSIAGRVHIPTMADLCRRPPQSRTAGFPGSVLKPWHFIRGLPKVWRGLNAGPYTPPPSWFAPPSSLLNCHRDTPVLSGPPPAANEAAKCPEPLCPTSVLPSLGRGGPSPPRALPPCHHSYGPHVPLPLGSPLLQYLASFEAVFAGCTQSLLPTGPSRRYL